MPQWHQIKRCLDYPSFCAEPKAESQNPHQDTYVVGVMCATVDSATSVASLLARRMTGFGYRFEFESDFGNVVEYPRHRAGDGATISRALCGPAGVVITGGNGDHETRPWLSGQP